MEQKEFQKRCEEVFLTNEGDEYYGIEILPSGTVSITMSETGTKQEGYRNVIFSYEPDMSGRPQALDYLLGKRDDFND